MKTIDLFATERHFVDHLAPIWAALSDKARGRFVVPEALVAHARERGIDPHHSLTRQSRPVLVAAYGDLRRVRAAGRRRIAFVEHGIGQTYSNDHPSYPGGRDRDDVGLFLVANSHSLHANRSAYPEARVVAIGCPKLDSTPAREPQPQDDGKPTLAISFHWDPGSVAPEARSAWRAFRFGMVGLVRQHRVLGHGHPRMLSKLRPWYSKFGVEVVPDFADVCRRADLYICDNSSTLYEFAATGRPVVVMNAPWYRRRVEHGMRFWEAASVGLQVARYPELHKAIPRALADDAATRANREAALDIAYAYRTGAAKRAAKALQEWLA